MHRRNTRSGRDMTGIVLWAWAVLFVVIIGDAWKRDAGMQARTASASSLASGGQSRPPAWPAPVRLGEEGTQRVHGFYETVEAALNAILFDAGDGVPSRGDYLLEVDCGRYEESVNYNRRWTDHESEGPINLHIKGREGCAERPHFIYPADSGGGSTFSFNDQNARKWEAVFKITGLEISDGNFECVDSGKGWTRIEIRDSYLHHCRAHVLQPGRPMDGIDGVLVVEGSELAFGPKLHVVYVVPGIAQAVFRRNVIHSPDGGNALKCLADNCLIENNVVSNVGPSGDIITSRIPRAAGRMPYIGINTVEVLACGRSVIRENRIIFRGTDEEGRRRSAVFATNRRANGGCFKPKYDTPAYWAPKTWQLPRTFAQIVRGNELVCLDCSEHTRGIETRGTNQRDRTGQLKLPDIWVERSVVFQKGNQFDGFGIDVRPNHWGDDTVIPDAPVVTFEGEAPPVWTVNEMPTLLRTDVAYVVRVDEDPVAPVPASDPESGRQPVPAKFSKLISDMPRRSWIALPVDEEFGDETLRTERQFKDAFVREGFAGINPRNKHYSVIAQWSGGAYDPERRRHYHWGSGHGAYDNGIYAFDLGDLAWHRLQPPIPDLTCDRAPLATHSYDTVQYHNDRLYVINHWSSGDPCREALPKGQERRNFGFWAYEFGTSEWVRLLKDFRSVGWPGRRRWNDLNEGMHAGSDIIDGWIVMIGQKYYWSYNIATGQVKMDRHGGGFYPQGSAAYGAGYFLRHTGESVIIYRVSEGVPTLAEDDMARRSEALMSLGERGDGTGIDYDPDTGMFWTWNDGCMVKAIDPSDWSVQVLPNVGCPVVEGANNGIYSNWQHLPEFGVFLGVNNTLGRNGAYVWKP